VWCVLAVGLFFFWPWTGWRAIGDSLKGIDGELPVPLALRKISSISIAPETVLPPTLLAPELRGRTTPMLPFPYENYIPVVLKRPLLAPVLQSYSAPTEALQRFYVDAIDRQRSNGLDVVYGLDSVATWPVDEVQTITRVPLVFEYLYRHFELSSTEENLDGRYVLGPRARPRDVVFQELPLTENRSDHGSGTLRLAQPTACNLIRLEMKTTYSPARLMLRPSGVELKFSRGSDLVFTGYVRPLELNREFITYISLIKPAMFYKVFGSSLIPGKVWDAITYHPLKTDVLGTSPLKIDVNHIQCVGPEMFAEGDASQDVPEVQSLFTSDILKGRTETGYVLLTAQPESMPELRVRLGFSRGIQTYADVQATPMASSYSIKLNSVFANDVGLAIVNPGKTPIRIEIAYRGDESMRSVALILNGAQQSSKFLSELLSMEALLSGTLEISSEAKFAILAVQFSGARFLPLRVDRSLPAIASNERFILFPQFAIHGGWATALMVSNRNSTTAAGRIRIFSSSGDPMPVTLNGVTSSTFGYSVRPGSLYVLSPGVNSPGASK